MIPNASAESTMPPDEIVISEPPWKPTFVAGPEPAQPETPDIDWDSVPEDDSPAIRTIKRKPRNIIPLPDRPALQTVEFFTQFSAYVSILISFVIVGYGVINHAWALCVAGFGMLFGSIAYLAYAELLRVVLDVEIRLHEISSILSEVEFNGRPE